MSQRGVKHRFALAQLYPVTSTRELCGLAFGGWQEGEGFIFFPYQTLDPSPQGVRMEGPRRQYILDEAERSLHDALCVVSQTLKVPPPRSSVGMACYLLPLP